MRHPFGIAFITMALLTPLPIMASGADDLDESKQSSAKESAGSVGPASTRPLTLTDTALADAREILSGDNSCSSFFGGASEVVAVLDGLAGRIQMRKLPDRFVGIRMSGGESTFISYLSGYQYRLFRKVIINTNGPFYNSGNAIVPMPRCGSFWPNTREARVLMLLHELGHMIKGANGKWLLADDGGSDQLSQSNTRTVESRCMAQIKGLELRERLAGKSEDEAGDKR
jgi:hypothetical protein